MIMRWIKVSLRKVLQFKAKELSVKTKPDADADGIADRNDSNIATRQPAGKK